MLAGLTLGQAVSCQAPPRPLEVRRNYQENYAVRQILLGYFPVEEVPDAAISTARARMRATVPCQGYAVLEDGITDRSETNRTYDSFTKTVRSYVETKAYYWQKYRCRKPFTIKEMNPPPGSKEGAKGTSEMTKESEKAQPKAEPRPPNKAIP